MPMTLLTALELLNPSQTSSLLVSPALSPFLYLTDSEFSWNFPCPCSNFVLIALGTLHSTCPLRPSLNASILHEVFLDFSSLPKHYSLLLRHGICYLGNSGVFVRYRYYLYNCLIPSLESTFVDSWCLAHGRT